MRAKRPWPRITAARVDLYLDKLAEIMAASGKDAALGVPLWKRLEKERDRLRDEEATVAGALDRITRLKDQREARS